MMLERHSMENAELYALGMLPSESVADFERELHRNTDLQTYLHELEDSIAGIALTSPQIEPPARVLDSILAGQKPPLRSRFFLPPYAAAAIFILSGLTIHQGITNHQRTREITLLKDQLAQQTQKVQLEKTQSLSSSRLLENKFTGLEPRLQNLLFRPDGSPIPSYVLVQDLENKTQKLKKLEREKSIRQQYQAGVSRMVVTKLLDPKLSAEEKFQLREILSAELSDIIITGLEEKETESDPTKSDNNVLLSGRDNTEGANFIIEEGMIPAGMINLPEGTTLLHRNFPIDRLDEFRNIESLPDDSFYDRQNQIHWTQGADGFFRGSRVTEQPGGTSPPQPQAEIEEPNTTSNALPDPQAYTLYDEITDEGLIVVSNLPAPAEGTAYQFWMNDPIDGTPVSLGVIENFEGGDGIISYELPSPDLSPTNYRLTIEPAEGSSSPTGPTLLIGPE